MREYATRVHPEAVERVVVLSSSAIVRSIGTVFSKLLRLNMRRYRTDAWQKALDDLHAYRAFEMAPVVERLRAMVEAHGRTL